MFEIIEQAKQFEEKIHVSIMLFRNQSTNRQTLIQYLRSSFEEEPETPWGRWCQRFCDGVEKKKVRRPDEKALLTYLKSSASDYSKLEVLKSHQSHLYVCIETIQWMENAIQHGSSTLQAGCERLLSQILTENRLFTKSLEPDYLPRLQDPLFLDDFLKMDRIHKLWWLIQDRDDDVRYNFLLIHALELLNHENDCFILSNLMKRIPEAMLSSPRIDLDLLQTLMTYLEHEDSRVRANLVEGFGVLSAKARYRGFLYPNLRSLLHSAEPRTRANTLAIMMKYTPNDTEKIVKEWIHSANTLKEMCTLEWLLSTIPELQSQVQVYLKAMREKLLGKARLLVQQGVEVSEMTQLA